jgi:hypothetical protein
MPVLLHYPHPPPPSSSPIVAPRNRDGGREGRKEIETNSSLRLVCQPCLALPSYLRSNELCGILALGFPVLDSGFHSSSNATNPPSRSPVPEELLPPGIRSAESSWIGGALRLAPKPAGPGAAGIHRYSAAAAHSLPWILCGGKQNRPRRACLPPPIIGACGARTTACSPRPFRT